MATREDATSVEDELTCFLCKQLFKNPLTLTCCHTFCEECIVSHINSSEDSPTCALCQEPIKGEAFTLKSNCALNELVALVTANQEKIRNVSSKAICQICEDEVESSSALRCLDCNITYCVPCRSSCHPDKGVFTKHEIYILTESKNRVIMRTGCQVHRKEFVYVCLDCGIPVCFDCHNDKHNGHASEMLSKAVSDQRKQILSAMDSAERVQKNRLRITDSQKQNLFSMKINQDQRIQCIKECFRSLRLALNAKEQELLDKEMALVGEHVNIYETMINATEADSLHLKSILSVANKTIAEGQELAVIIMSKTLNENLQLYSSALSSHDDHDPFVVVPCVPDNIDTADVRKTIDLIGVELNVTESNTMAEGCPKGEQSPLTIGSTNTVLQTAHNLPNVFGETIVANSNNMEAQIIKKFEEDALKAFSSSESDAAEEVTSQAELFDEDPLVSSPGVRHGDEVCRSVNKPVSGRRNKKGRRKFPVKKVPTIHSSARGAAVSTPKSKTVNPEIILKNQECNLQ